jgi:glycosyltransferase involved in cell wall biosynthesis
MVRTPGTLFPTDPRYLTIGQPMRSIAPSSVWVICPAFNEATTLPRVLKELRDAGYKVVVVDDGSSDETPRIGAAMAAAVISHPINLGQGAALKTGIAYALSQGAQVLATFDADGQHRISDIACLLEALEGADFALGSRFLQGSRQIPLIRRQLLRAATLFTIATTGLCLTDSHNGLRAFTRRGATALSLRQNRMAHASEILADIARSGLRHVEVPVTIEYTRYSMQKGQRTADFIMILLDLFAQRLYR